MHKSFIAAVFALLLLFAGNSTADQLSIPLQIDYGLIKKVLISQLYTGKDNTAELWNDRQGCSYLRLSKPDVILRPVKFAENEAGIIPKFKHKT